MTVTEKVAYLKGLAEGLNVAEDTKEGKLLRAIMDVLTDMAADLEDVRDCTAELTEQVDAIDEDLDQLEMDYYEDYEDYDDCDCDCCSRRRILRCLLPELQRRVLRGRGYPSGGWNRMPELRRASGVRHRGMR